MTWDDSTRRRTLDDHLNGSCPPCYHEHGRVYTKRIKPDTLTTLPRPCRNHAEQDAPSAAISDGATNATDRETGFAINSKTRHLDYPTKAAW